MELVHFPGWCLIEVCVQPRKNCICGQHGRETHHRNHGGCFSSPLLEYTNPISFFVTTIYSAPQPLCKRSGWVSSNEFYVLTLLEGTWISSRILPHLGRLINHWFFTVRYYVVSFSQHWYSGLESPAWGWDPLLLRRPLQLRYSSGFSTATCGLVCVHPS